MSNLEETVRITVERGKEVCQVTLQTPGYEIYIGAAQGEIGEFIGHTPVTFYAEPKEERVALGFRKYITVKKNDEVVKGCLGTPFILHKGLDVGDCWSVEEITPPSGGIFIPHKGTETGLAFDIDDKRAYGWIDFYGEADRVEVYIDGEHKGVILDAFLIIYLAPGTYRVEQESAGVRCYSDALIYKGDIYHTSETFINAGEGTIIDSDMYRSPIDPPPQYVLDATIRHFQEHGWTRLRSQWGCGFASCKTMFTQELCYTSKVPEVCGYENATHYWLLTHPGFVFPETEICEVQIETPGYSIEIATQPGVTTPRPSTPVTFNCASIPISDGIYECTKYITLFKPTKGVVHTCNDAKIVFRKVVGGDWYIDKEKSSSCTDVFEYTATDLSITLTIKLALGGYVNISKSTIPSTIFTATPATFSFNILNTGAIDAKYHITLGFEGINIEHEETFESEWSEKIAPNETVTLPVVVELSGQAIVAGQESAVYSIHTKLEAT